MKSKAFRRIVSILLVIALISSMGIGAMAAIPPKESTYGKYSGYSEDPFPGYIVKSQYVEVPAYYTGASRSDPYYADSSVKLALDYILPADVSGNAVAGKYPTIVVASRGGRFSATDSVATDLVKHGYAYVIIEMRGCGASFGVNNSFASVENRLDVKYIMENWIANQPWSNGKYAMMGGSNRGLIQEAVAATAPNGLLGVTPVVCDPDFYYQDYINGVSACPSGMNLSGTNIDTTLKTYGEWMDPKVSKPKFVDADTDGSIAYQAYVYQTQKNKAFTTYLLAPNLLRDSENKDLYNEKVNLTIPPIEYNNYIINSGVKFHQLAGLFDSNTATQVAARNAWGGSIVIGPWTHGGTMSGKYDESKFPNSNFDVTANYLRWFDYLLKGVDNGYDQAPPFYYYVVGSESGKEWRYSDNLPLENQINAVLYLASTDSTVNLNNAQKLSGAQSNNGLLVTSKPKTLTSVDYTTDTSVTTPTGFMSMNLISSVDWSQSVDSKGLTFTTSPYAAATQLTGIPQFDIWVSSDNSNDADFCVYLEEVAPDGKSTYLSRGYIRASHRAIGSSKFYDATEGSIYHPSMTADVNAALAEGMKNPVELKATFDMLSTTIKAGNSLRFTVTTSNTALCQDYMNYELVDGKYVLKTSNLPKISLYQGGDKASSITIPTVKSVNNVINGTVTFTDGSFTGPGTMYLFNKNYYLYANGKWRKLPLSSAISEYNVVNNAAVFKKAGFSFKPEGTIIADGIAQNYTGGATGDFAFPSSSLLGAYAPYYKFTVGNTTKSFYAESLDALNVNNNGSMYMTDASTKIIKSVNCNEPSTNYINTKFYLDNGNTSNTLIKSSVNSVYPGSLSWVVPENGSITTTLSTPYSTGVPDTSGATFSSAGMYSMYSNQYIVGYPFADLVVSSAAGGTITAVLEHVSGKGVATAIAIGSATIAENASNTIIHIPLLESYETRSDGSTYVAYNLSDGSLRLVLYGNSVNATFAIGESGSSITVPFVDNTENVINGKITIDSTQYNGTMYRFYERTYVNYTKTTQNDSWISFPTDTAYTLGTDNAASFQGLGKTVKFLMEGTGLIRNGEAQTYKGNSSNSLSFPRFYYLDTVMIKPVSDYLYMPGFKTLRGVIYTPATAALSSNGYPTVIYVHGYNGQYSSIGTYMTGLLSKGYAIAGIDLRNYPSNVSPDHYTDIKGNIRHIRANANKYGLDASSIGIYGASLGGNSALMAAVSGDDPDVEGTVGGNVGVSSRVQAAVVGYGWTDLLNFGLDQRNDQYGDPASKITSMLSGGDGEYAPAAEVVNWYGAGRGLLMLRNFLSQYASYQNGITSSTTSGAVYSFDNSLGSLTYHFTVDDAYVSNWFPSITANIIPTSGSVITKGSYAFLVSDLLAAVDRAYAASPLYHISAGSSNISNFAGFGGAQNITNNQTTRTMLAYNNVDATAFEAGNSLASSAGYGYGASDEVTAEIDQYLNDYLKNKPADTKIVLYAANNSTRKYNAAANYVSYSQNTQPVIFDGSTAYISYDVLNSMLATPVSIPTAEKSGVNKLFNGSMYGTVSAIASATGCTVKSYNAGGNGAYIPWYDDSGNVLSEVQRTAGSYGIVTLSKTNGNLIAGTSISTAGKNTVTASTATRDTSYYTAAPNMNSANVLVNNNNYSAPKYYYNVVQTNGSSSWRYSDSFPTEDSNSSTLYLDDLASITGGGSGNAGTLNAAVPDTSSSVSGTSLTFTSAANMSTSGTNSELIGFASANLWVSGTASTTANLTVNIGLLSGTTYTPIVSKTVSTAMTVNPVNVKIDFPNAISQAYANGSYFYITVTSDSSITVSAGGNYVSSITLPTTERNYNVFNGTVTLSNGIKYAGTMYLFNNAFKLYYNGVWIKLIPNNYSINYQTLSDGTIICLANFAANGFSFEPEARQYNGRAQDYTGGTARGSAAFPNYNRVKVANVPVQPLKDGLYLPTTKTLYTNIYLPNSASSDPAPLVIYVHGFGGDISGIDTLCMTLLANGYAVAGADLRAYPPECTPDWYADLSGSVRFLRVNANIYRLNPDKFAIYGESLGGNSSLGSAIGVGSSLEGSVGGNTNVSSRVQAAAIGYGWTDIMNFGADQRSDNAVRKDLMTPMLSGSDGETAPIAQSINWYGAGKGILMLRNFKQQYELYNASGTNGNINDTAGKAYNFFTDSSGQLCYKFTIDGAYKNLWFFSADSTNVTNGTYTYTVTELLAAIERANATSPISYVSPDDPVMALYGGFGGSQNITNNQSMRTFQTLQNNGVLTFYYGNTQGSYGRTSAVKAGLLKYFDKWLKGNVSGTKIVLKAGSGEAVINYKSWPIATPLLFENKTAYIPIAYVAKVIGADVSGVTASTPGVIQRNGSLYVTASGLSGIASFNGITASWYPASQTMVLTGNKPLTALNSTVSATSLNFDKYAQATSYKDVPVSISLGMDTLSEIYNGSTKLTNGTDYSVSVDGKTVTIPVKYLQAQPLGNLILTFKFISSSYQNITINISDSTPSGGGGSGGGSSGGGTITDKTTITNSGNETRVSTIVTGTVSSGTVSANVPDTVMASLSQNAADAEKNGKDAVVEIRVDTANSNSASVQISAAALKQIANSTNADLSISTGIASLTFDSKAVESISGTAPSGDIKVNIASADKSSLSPEARAIVGERPVYDFSVTAGGNKIASFGGGSVSVGIPYTPANGEDPNAIVVYYIDSNGALQYVMGAYNVASGMVEFTTSHFSQYAIGYNKVLFKDVTESAWYYNAVSFIAARNITTGTSSGLFSPNDTLNRGQFIVMLMRAYGISPDEKSSDNFADAGNDYYTNYLSAAKRLGITTGIGDNQFGPDLEISRQDMFTLIYRALDKLGMLPTTSSGKALASFSDFGQISDYAKIAVKALVESGKVNGSDGLVNPFGKSTRAEMAQILYNLLSKQG